MWNLIVVIATYLCYNYYLYQLFFGPWEEALCKGFFYLLVFLSLLWFIIDIARGWVIPQQSQVCILYLTGLSSLYLVFGLSILFIIKEHPILYMILSNGAVWVSTLTYLLVKITYRHLKD